MTEEEYVKMLSSEARQDFQKLEKGEITFLELAEKYKQTTKKVTLMNAYTAWKSQEEYNELRKAKRNADYFAMLDKSMSEAEAGGFVIKNVEEQDE